jgi:hypothetical protein
MMLAQNSNQQPSKKRNWMMLIIASRPTVNVIVVTINVIDVDQMDIIPLSYASETV